MAANRQVSAASRRRVRLSGWVLSPFQVTLALCGVAVGFLACFGLGFLSGVWFQTQEQMIPHDDAITLADNQLEREQTSASGQEMTFYSALPSRDGAPASVPPSQVATAASPVSESEPPTAALPPAAASSGIVEPAPLPGQGEAAKTVLAAPPSPTGSEPEGPNEPREGRGAAAPPASKPEPPPTASAAEPEEKFYSIQVGSFRRIEQAYRLQDVLLKKGYQARIGFSIVEGKGGWYRVRVGRFADRTSADKTAQRLQQKEKVDVLVMRVSS